jgi:protein-disulfide isomerase
MESTNQNGAFFEKYGTALAVLLGALIIGGAFVYGRGTAPAPAGGEPAAVDIADVDAESSPSIGDANAPVVMAVWYDYQCPFCKRFELDTVSKLYTDYVQTGKLRIVFKDFQFLGPDSATASLFGRAMWEAYPERFYEWYVAMAENQDEEHGGFGDLASIEEMTRGLGGIDVDRVTGLMEDKRAEYQAAIEADRAEGASFGISGTPSMIIGTSALSGAQPYDRVAALIEAELAK